MYIIIFFVGLLVDQLTKFWAIKNLKSGDDIIIIKDWLHLTYLENSGAAFGIFQNATIIFSVITVATCFFIMYYILKNFNNIDIYIKLSLVMIMSGAIGNLIDRIRLGYVVDFIYTPLGGIYDFPVFNFADIFITISTIVLIIVVFFSKNENGI